MNTIKGQLYVNSKTKIAIVIARFNDFLTQSLLKGAQDGLLRSGVAESDIDVYWVPGAYEIPLVCKKLASGKDYDAIITLGAVIRGATSHYDVVVNESTSGISQVSLDYQIPIILGILTVENIEQGIERAGTKAGNRGFDYACNAIEMVNLIKQIDK